LAAVKTTSSSLSSLRDAAISAARHPRGGDSACCANPLSHIMQLINHLEILECLPGFSLQARSFFPLKF
jgi:hypothetical protein